MYQALPFADTLGGPELVVIILVLLLLFGGKELPEVARGTGRALRIFKAETKGLLTDDDDDPGPSSGSKGAITGSEPPAQDPPANPPA